MSNEEIIWDYFMNYTNNAYGTAALMGNLMAESSLNPKCVTGVKDANYVAKADSGEIDFAHDGHAFGLVQWCYYARKGGLLSYAKSRGKSVGDLHMQLDYTIKELTESYKSVWNAIVNATSIRSASDTIMLKYEKPAGTGEAQRQKRANYGQTYYDKYARPSPAPTPAGKKMVRATNQVNIRITPDKTVPRLGELKKGQQAEYLGTENGFRKIAVYVSADYSKVIET